MSTKTLEIQTGLDGIADPKFWFEFRKMSMTPAEQEWFEATFDFYHYQRVDFFEAALAKVTANVKKVTKVHKEKAKNVAEGTFGSWRFKFEAATDFFEGVRNPKFGVEDDTFGGAPKFDKVYIAELAAWLKGQTWSEFAQSLAAYHEKTGELSEKQIASGTSMREKMEKRAADKDKAAKKNEEALKTEDPIDLTDLRSGIYAVPNGETRLKVRISRSKNDSANGRWKAGTIWVNDDAAYGDRTLYGFQAPDETQYKGKIRDALRAILADPFEAQKAYGRLVGVCGNCNKRLEDAESIERGLGPVCYGKALDFYGG